MVVPKQIDKTLPVVTAPLASTVEPLEQDTERLLEELL
jgi:hypothetical protein